MALASSGQIRGGTVLPSTSATTSANSETVRTLRMSLNAGRARCGPSISRRLSTISKAACRSRRPMSANILDPMSALIMAVPAGRPLVGPAACDGTIPIYDGVVRFDLTMSYVGTRDVSATGYSGPVSICAVRYRPIAGHGRDSRSTAFMAQNREIEIWLAPRYRGRPCRRAVPRGFGDARRLYGSRSDRILDRVRPHHCATRSLGRSDLRHRQKRRRRDYPLHFRTLFRPARRQPLRHRR